jgi:pilus assembly protein Flp/PilA
MTAIIKIQEIKTSKKQRGATMVEYAIMVALIAIVAIAAVKFLGQQVSGTFSNAGAAMSSQGVVASG